MLVQNKIAKIPHVSRLSFGLLAFNFSANREVLFTQCLACYFVRFYPFAVFCENLFLFWIFADLTGFSNQSTNNLKWWSFTFSDLGPTINQ